MSGAIDDIGDNGDMTGIEFKTADIRKYTFAYLLNCYSKEKGRKVKALYFVVEI